MMTPGEQLSKVVSELFGSLNHPDQIADLCRNRQIQGFLTNSTSCPLAKLVRERMEFPVAFTMGKKFGTGQFIVMIQNKTVAIPSPMICDEFSDKFDLSQYPDLINFNT